jgi:glycosyltransferase involved in cell wall biosynthesis
MDSSVDIILPTYRTNIKFFKRAIESIIHQSFKEWTLYIVQDGGETSLADIVQNFNEGRMVFNYLSHVGKAAAVNFALKKGSGKYIAYLDDDDIWYQNHLEVALNTIKEKGVPFVHTDAYEIFIRKEKEELCEVSRNILNRGSLSDYLLWYVSHINTVHERVLLDQAGYYDESRKIFIDWDMLLRLARITKPYHIPIVTCEHYIYLSDDNQKENTISQLHTKDPQDSKRMHEEMFKRAFELLSPDDFIKIAWELFRKTDQLAKLTTHKNDIAGDAPQVSTVKQSVVTKKYFKLLAKWLRKK